MSSQCSAGTVYEEDIFQIPGMFGPIINQVYCTEFSPVNGQHTGTGTVLQRPLESRESLGAIFSFLFPKPNPRRGTVEFFRDIWGHGVSHGWRMRCR